VFSSAYGAGGVEVNGQADLLGQTDAAALRGGATHRSGLYYKDSFTRTDKRI
jgi:hypothetical protein